MAESQPLPIVGRRIALGGLALCRSPGVRCSLFDFRGNFPGFGGVPRHGGADRYSHAAVKIVAAGGGDQRCSFNQKLNTFHEDS